ncbi:hypothetical protein OV320_3070 [Actinobacteria bacterium OV320]|nr:hypothetical protein OV320_3070 [Actinobacteria bacterium OV320]
MLHRYSPRRRFPAGPPGIVTAAGAAAAGGV